MLVEGILVLRQLKVDVIAVVVVYFVECIAVESPHELSRLTSNQIHLNKTIDTV